MTWQDELRRLDEELAAGRISADDYRVSRDRVLAAAANPTPAAMEPEPKAPPLGEQTQLIQPSTPPPPQPSESDRTQQVQPGWTVGDKNDADRTQVVPGAGQPMSPQHPMSPPGGMARPVPPWEQQEPLPPQWSGAELPATPWAGGEFGGHGGEAWLKQGPEIFEERRSNTGKIVAIVAAVVLLIGVAVGAFFLFGRDTGQAGAGGGQTTTQNPPTPTTTKPPDPMAIADIPGAKQEKEVKTFADVPALNYLTPAEISAYEKAEPSKAAVRIVKLESGSTAVVLVVEAGSPAAAKDAVAALVELQLTNKATKATDAPEKVIVTQFEGQLRAHYAHKNVIIRVETANADPAKSAADLDKVLQAQLKVSAADG